MVGADRDKISVSRFAGTPALAEKGAILTDGFCWTQGFLRGVFRSRFPHPSRGTLCPPAKKGHRQHHLSVIFAGGQIGYCPRGESSGNREKPFRTSSATPDGSSLQSRLRNPARGHALWSVKLILQSYLPGLSSFARASSTIFFVKTSGSRVASPEFPAPYSAYAGTPLRPIPART